MKIPNGELKKGVELCFRNASSLIEDAEILVEHGSYGHARFLALSAIEEICKAFIYALNRIGVWKDEELARDITNHKSKFAIFVFSLLLNAVSKRIEKGDIAIKKPLDIADFDKMGKDLESAINDMKKGREESLYIDYQEGKWMSPSDVPREETESWIKFAQTKNTEFELFCNNIMNAPIELAREFQEFIDNQFLPLVRDQFYNIADELYKSNVISGKLYEKILNRKKGYELGKKVEKTECECICQQWNNLEQKVLPILGKRESQKTEQEKELESEYELFWEHELLRRTNEKEVNDELAEGFKKAILEKMFRKEIEK